MNRSPRPGRCMIPAAAYASQPARLFSRRGVAATTSASRPMPAMAAKVSPPAPPVIPAPVVPAPVIPAPSAPAAAASATARSIRRSCPPNAVASDPPIPGGMPSARAARLAVPSGTIASGTCVPARACAQARTVPSPPAATPPGRRRRRPRPPARLPGRRGSSPGRTAPSHRPPPRGIAGGSG